MKERFSCSKEPCEWVEASFNNFAIICGELTRRRVVGPTGERFVDCGNHKPITDLPPTEGDRVR
jgi:hypothetical protein